MKIRPVHLFLLLTVLAVALAFLMRASQMDIAIHDTYFIIDYTYFFIPIAFFSTVTALCYFLMDKLGRPVSIKTGFWHFGLITAGLFLSLNTFTTLQLLFGSNAPDTTAFGGSIVFLLIVSAGPLLLLAGAVVFVVGMIRAFRRKNKEV
ncbi:MAG: hypothetical protein JWO09_175 [Bacteroidetes bacterium]|nr:hypothetical protein [Bacteroidota bacterium]